MQAEHSHTNASLLFIFFNVFSLSRHILLKWFQGHLKGHDGKNWAYIVQIELMELSFHQMEITWFGSFVHR